jgi:transcriptional repressor NF-X1
VNAQISDLTGREQEWVSDVEDGFRYLVLYRTKGIRLHVFCEMPKEKRDTLKLLAERCNFSVYSTGRDPRCVLIVQATQKSRAPPPHSMNPKGSLPKTGQDSEYLH